MNRSEAQRPALEVLERLEKMLKRLPPVDIFQKATEAADQAIQVRTLRSRIHIGYVYDQVVDSSGQHFDAVRLELINALWWEIQAIGLLRKYAKGRRKGAIGDVQKVLRSLLEEKPAVDTHYAESHLNRKLPDHGLKRKSITVALSKARKAARRW